MTDRRRERQIDNYAYFFGNVTEEEQQYMDYFETDIENDIEDEFVEGKRDEYRIAQSGEFDPQLYDFVETAMVSEVHENF